MVAANDLYFVSGPKLPLRWREQAPWSRERWEKTRFATSHFPCSHSGWWSSRLY